ncbi:hypothetical protein [Sneathiella aquimaris]|uniref:hypothetical protein n=1 Tax=Sneathiella aquimaris TaxID=2599305 RepID=UPI00146CEE95|nr:hypothetical protein [Sneathiella aquimaris]
MSGIKSTPGGAVTPSVDTNRGASSTQQQITPVTPTSPTGGGTGSTIPHASSVSDLSEGARIAAIVTARASGGDTMLHAEIGNFRMTTANPLPVGAHIVLEVDTVDELIVARIIAINGEKLAAPPSVKLLSIVPARTPLEGYGSGQIPKTADLPALSKNLAEILGHKTPSLSQAHPSASAAAASTSSTTTTAPAPSQATAQTTAPAPTPGSNFSNVSVPLASMNVGDGKVPGGQSAQSGVAAYAHTKSPGIPFIPPSVNPMATRMDPIPEGSVILVRATVLNTDQNPLTRFGALTSGEKISLSIAPNSAKASLPAASLALNGVITSATTPKITGMGQNIAVSNVTALVQGLGNVQYSAQTAPQVGVQITAAFREDLQTFPLTTPPTATGIFKIPHLAILNDWENLRAAMNLLALQNPEQAAALMNTRIPTANNQLASSLLFLISALNGGSMDKWLGQEFRRSLESTGNRNLLQKLDDDFSTFARLNTDSGGQDWKLFSFPFLHEHALRQIKMYYRQHHENPDTNERESTRFVIELDLTKTGPVQLDGLFKDARFDLVFRSQLPVEDTLKQQVGEIFTTNLEITGIKGSLVFQKIMPFPVHPTEEWENTGPEFIRT